MYGFRINRAWKKIAHAIHVNPAQELTHRVTGPVTGNNVVVATIHTIKNATRTKFVMRSARASSCNQMDSLNSKG